MSIVDRLRQLERHVGGCPECGAGNDDGEPTFRHLPPGERPKPCPLCGVTPRAIRMRPVRIGEQEQPAPPAGLQYIVVTRRRITQ